MHQSYIPQCTILNQKMCCCVHISATKWYICGIFVICIVRWIYSSDSFRSLCNATMKLKTNASGADCYWLKTRSMVLLVVDQPISYVNTYDVKSVSCFRFYLICLLWYILFYDWVSFLIDYWFNFPSSNGQWAWFQPQWEPHCHVCCEKPSPNLCLQT